MIHPLEKLKKEELVAEKMLQEKEEKLKMAEIDRISEERKKLLDKSNVASEKDKINLESQIQKFDQKIKKLNNTQLDKIRCHIIIIDNLIFIHDNKKILVNEGVMSRLTNLTKSRLDELLGKIDLKDQKARNMILSMDIGHGLGEKIGILLKMLRPQGTISPLCACFSGIYLANMGFPSYLEIIMPFMLIILEWFGGILLNDYFDYETDSVVDADRLILSRKIAKKDILNAAIFLILMTFLTSLFISIKISIITGIAILLIILYNSTLKKMGLLGSISFGIIEGLAFVLGFSVIGVFNKVLIFMTASIIFLHTSVNMIGAIKDIEGDIETKTWTVPAKYGINITVQLIIFFLFLSLTMAYIPGRLNLLNLRYMPSLIAIIFWLIIITITVKNDSKLGFMALGMYDMGASIYYINFITGI